MLKIIRIISVFFFALTFASCDKSQPDDIYPEIDLTRQDLFPKTCDTLIYDNTYTIILHLKDNVELNNYNIDIFHNFDHHFQVSETGSCELDDVRNPVYPFIYTNTFQIPPDLKEYTTYIVIWFPVKDCCDNYYDEGDYVFLVKVSDKAGNTSEKSMKIRLERE